MADELIDRLDENGNHVGTIMKSVAHSIGAWHRSVHIYLVNDENELIIQQRSPDKDLFPNLWDISVGGHVSAGEETVISAQRELSEELGINAKTGEFQYLFTFKEIFKQGDFISKEFVDVYLIEKNIKKENIHLQDEEVSNYKFISVKEFLTMIDNNDKTLIPHTEEYEKIKGLLKEKFIKK